MPCKNENLSNRTVKISGTDNRFLGLLIRGTFLPKFNNGNEPIFY
jgi:hypothetical protein